MTRRCFVALDLSDEVRTTVVGVIESWRTQFDENVRWVQSANLHVTMLFIGNVADDRMTELCGCVRRAVEKSKPIVFELSKFEAWPNSNRASVLVVNLNEPNGDNAADLALRLRREFSAANFAFDQKSFRPHITVARFRRPVRVDTEQKSLPIMRWSIQDVRLMTSQLTKVGSIYHLEDVTPLLCKE